MQCCYKLPGLAERKVEHSTGRVVNDHPSSNHNDLTTKGTAKSLIGSALSKGYCKVLGKTVNSALSLSARI
jgi:hypothetical protein